MDRHKQRLQAHIEAQKRAQQLQQRIEKRRAKDPQPSLPVEHEGEEELATEKPDWMSDREWKLELWRREKGRGQVTKSGTILKTPTSRSSRSSYTLRTSRTLRTPRESSSRFGKTPICRKLSTASRKTPMVRTTKTSMKTPSRSSQRNASSRALMQQTAVQVQLPSRENIQDDIPQKNLSSCATEGASQSSSDVYKSNQQSTDDASACSLESEGVSLPQAPVVTAAQDPSLAGPHTRREKSESSGCSTPTTGVNANNAEAERKQRALATPAYGPANTPPVLSLEFSSDSDGSDVSFTDSPQVATDCQSNHKKTGAPPEKPGKKSFEALLLSTVLCVSR